MKIGEGRGDKMGKKEGSKKNDGLVG